jgi:2-dehydro-3-deoxyphosphogluconate aldolase / (4S)-4-hydroxy-2-oxoglutarate aldolase
MTDLLSASPVVPVVVIDEVETAVPLARALAAGGVRIIEVTLRTEAALAAIAAISAELPEVLVGAGTICSRQQVKASMAAGARFLVSPGATDRLLDAFEDSGVPFLAGVATPSEMLRLLEREITTAKLFPATAVGGLALLRAVYGPLPGLRFCPTGGIDAANAGDFLALPNVGCVGGSWLTPAGVVRARNWDEITRLAAAVSRFRAPSALAR